MMEVPFKEVEDFHGLTSRVINLLVPSHVILDDDSQVPFGDRFWAGTNYWALSQFFINCETIYKRKTEIQTVFDR